VIDESSTAAAGSGPAPSQYSTAEAAVGGAAAVAGAAVVSDARGIGVIGEAVAVIGGDVDGAVGGADEVRADVTSDEASVIASPSAAPSPSPSPQAVTARSVATSPTAIVDGRL
jgi:hypothetical protein